jgi:HK97 family phage prohead protease
MTGKPIEAKRTAFEFKFSDDGAKGAFSGYGAIFSNVDSYGDVLEKGAFGASLKEWEGKGKYPPMLLQHGGFFSADDMLPIGKWTSMEENAKGLKVEGELFALQTERGQYIYEGLKSGVLDGLSIGYRAKEFVIGTKPGEPRRSLKAVELIELSVVTFPANDKARISAVKSEIRTIRDFEAFLRDAGGYSNAAAKAIAAGGFKAQPDPRDEDGIGEAIAGPFQALANLIRS